MPEVNESSQAKPEVGHPGLLTGREIKLLIVGLQILAIGSCVLALQQLLMFGNFFGAVRSVYNFGTLYFPALFAVVGGVFAWQWRTTRPNPRLGFAAGAVLFVAVALVGVRVYATHIEPYRLQIHHAQIETDKVSRTIRILHISDTQCANVGGYEKKVFERMRELAPDLILFTGDFLQPLPPATYESESPKLAALFASLDPPLGKFGVLGNVDPPALCKRYEEEGGVTILGSEEALVDCGEGRIRILGMTLGQSYGGVAGRIQQWALGARKNDFNIVMGHVPDYVMSVPENSVDLCVAGHTHGGQIRLPFFGPLVTLSIVPRDWARGFRETKNTFLNVSAGIGSEHHSNLPSIRFNCPPEMTLIEVSPK